MVQYRALAEKEICRDIFASFNRRQAVTKCWRRENGRWVVRDDPFIDDWSEADYRTLVACLKNTVATGGVVYAAFAGGALKGFASVESSFFGGANKYLDLTSLHVSEELRGGRDRILPVPAGGGVGPGKRGKEAVYLRPLSRGKPGVL